jgi:hypothetical protein
MTLCISAEARHGKVKSAYMAAYSLLSVPQDAVRRVLPSTHGWMHAWRATSVTRRSIGLEPD